MAQRKKIVHKRPDTFNAQTARLNAILEPYKDVEIGDYGDAELAEIVQGVALVFQMTAQLIRGSVKAREQHNVLEALAKAQLIMAKLVAISYDKGRLSGTGADDTPAES